MKTKIFLSIVIAVSLTGIFSCMKETKIVKPSYTKLVLPEIPYQYNSFQSTNELITLGRVLFYDTHLSVNNSISCASCHKQQFAFSDNAAFSRGFENKLTSRNSLPIQNLSPGFFSMESTPLFWDGRESFLSSMVLKPITNHVEMGMDDDNAIANRVKNISYYPSLFSSAFGGDTSITSGQIGTAIAAFCSSLNSTSTKFDMFNSNQASLSGIETEGMNLFFTKYNCAGCHQSVTVPNPYGFDTSNAFLNIGLDVNYTDQGLGARTGKFSDNGRFKVPSLRNIVLTSPYMHDGRFATLNDVLEHYSHGIANNANLDSRLKDNNNQPKQMNISAHEKEAIIAFLNTMTDYTIVLDKKYSSPFEIVQ